MWDDLTEHEKVVKKASLSAVLMVEWWDEIEVVGMVALLVVALVAKTAREDN